MPYYKKKFTMNYLKELKQSEEFEYCDGASENEILFIENELNILLPNEYRKFLSQCGMCNFGDTRIEGVFKENGKISYPVVELTKQMREEANLPNDYIVLNYEPDEYITLYKASKDKKLNDAKVYGAEVFYNDDDSLKLGKIEEEFDDFQEYFEDFLDLADED